MSYSSELKKTLKDKSSKKKCCRRCFFYGEMFALPEQKRNAEIDWTKFGYEQDEKIVEIKPFTFACQSCRASFLRGVFCSVGTVSNPEKSFHLEMKFKDKEVADNVFEFVKENIIEMKRTQRGDVHSLYLKKCDDIEDLIHFLGADKEAFQVANEKIKRDFSNLANRRSNFEFGNITKTVNAAGETIAAINILEKKGKLSELPKGLEETARLRIENPYANLEELAEMHSDRISKSGVNHRLKKLIEIAEQA